MRRHLRSSSRIPESAIADKWRQTTLLFLSAPWSSSGPTASTLTNCDFTCPGTSSPVGAARKRLRAPPHNDPCWALQPLRQQVNCCSLSSNRASQRDPHSPESYGFLHVATITAVHGVHGAVKATSTSDFAAHRLSPTTESKYILLPGRLYPRPVTVTSSRPSSRANTWIVGLSCVESREDFGKMKLQGARLYVKAQDKPPLARGEFVAADLIDLNVCLLVTEENQDELQVGYTTSTRNRGDIKGSKSIAVVEEIIPSQAVSASKLANDVLQIAFFNNNNSSNDGSNYIDENSKRVLIPFVKQIVPIVDLSAGLIVIDPPEGLLDVAIVNQVKKPIKPRGYLMPAANV